jgi:cytochrome b pre-mRNA-processing protein 3
MHSSGKETYIAYGATKALYKDCSKQADYTIPQASQKGVEIPKSEKGEDLGVGEGYWYKGTFYSWTGTSTIG